MSDLTLEVRSDLADKTVHMRTPDGAGLMMTPAIDEDYWTFRVKVSDTQAVVGFPKFTTIGIGFAQEEDWNANLPYTCDAQEIFDHIAHNKGDDSIPDERCIEAIKAIQQAATEARS